MEKTNKELKIGDEILRTQTVYSGVYKAEVLLLGKQVIGGPYTQITDLQVLENKPLFIALDMSENRIKMVWGKENLTTENEAPLRIKKLFRRKPIFSYTKKGISTKKGAILIKWGNVALGRNCTEVIEKNGKMYFVVLQEDGKERIQADDVSISESYDEITHLIIYKNKPLFVGIKNGHANVLWGDNVITEDKDPDINIEFVGYWKQNEEPEPFLWIKNKKETELRWGTNFEHSCKGKKITFGNTNWNVDSSDRWDNKHPKLKDGDIPIIIVSDTDNKKQLMHGTKKVGRKFDQIYDYFLIKDTLVYIGKDKNKLYLMIGNEFQGTGFDKINETIYSVGSKDETNSGIGNIFFMAKRGKKWQMNQNGIPIGEITKKETDLLYLTKLKDKRLVWITGQLDDRCHYVENTFYVDGMEFYKTNKPLHNKQWRNKCLVKDI